MDNTSTETSTFRSDPVGTRRRSPPIWLGSLLFLVGLILFAVLVGRSEVARWHYASASNAIADQRYDDAIEAASTGLKWDPSYRELISLRAVARFEQGDFEGALEDYDQLIDLADEDEATTEDDIQPLAAKAQLLLRLGKFAEAVDSMATVVNFRREQYQLRDDFESAELYAWSLNNRAYMQAQAKLDVDTALEDIQRAMEIREPRVDPAMTDTLGYLQLLNGQHEAAVETLEQAVKDAAEARALQQQRLRQAMQQVVDQRPYEVQLRRLDENYSILLHHRGEAYRAAGNEERAQADIKKALELGYNPEEGIW